MTKIPEEVWKQYKDTSYQISSLGRVYNTKTKRYLKGTYGRNEYHSVQLSIDGKPKSFMTHRLVAELFCDNPNNYNVVDHIDHNKYNNYAFNLRWTSSEENNLNSNRLPEWSQKSEYIDSLEGFEEACVGDGNYLVSKDGIIVNAKTKRILHGQIRNGYHRVYLRDKFYSAHVIVWETFMGKVTPGCIIDHIDGNRSNNKLENLREITQSANVIHAYELGHSAQKAVFQYDLNGNFLKKYNSIVEASKEVECTAEAIGSAIKREGTCSGFFWSDEERKESAEELSEIIKKNTTRSDAKGISQYDANGNLVQHHLSLTAAAKAIGCATSTIARGNANRRKAKGFFWIYDTDTFTIEELLK